jgi:hypothetical protein
MDHMVNTDPIPAPSGPRRLNHVQVNQVHQPAADTTTPRKHAIFENPIKPGTASIKTALPIGRPLSAVG